MSPLARTICRVQHANKFIGRTPITAASASSATVREISNNALNTGSPAQSESTQAEARETVQDQDQNQQQEQEQEPKPPATSPSPSSEPKPQKKTQLQADEELRNKMAGLAGDGGEAGVETEGGKPKGMGRAVKDNMFRYI